MRNKVNTDAIYGFEENIFNNLSTSQITESVSGSWNFENEVCQFKSHVSSEYGNAIMQADTRTLLGGYGVQPSPIQYILFGIAAGFTNTMVSKAAINDYNIENINVKIIALTNYDKFFSIEDRSPVEQLKIIVDIKTEEKEEQINKLKEDVFDCCPTLFLIRNLDLDIVINIQRP